jgi:hypothetical protein
VNFHPTIFNDHQIMWPRQTTVEAMNDQFEHPSRTLMGMEKGGQQELFEFPGGFWTTEDGKGALATEDADSITLFDASPLGSELSSLPPLDLTLPPISSLDMSFLDSDMATTSGSSAQPLSSGQLDSALEDYTQTWRKLVYESSMLASSLFHHDQPHSEFNFDADPTPPLAFDFDVPAISATSSEAANQQSSVEVVAPKPIRLANPAIHLAALVENPDESAASVSQDGDTDDAEEDNVVEEGSLNSALQFYGYSMEQLREYMSDSESSSDEPEPGQEAEQDTTPNLAPFQFIFPTHHDLPNPSTAQYYDTLPPSPFSALSPPASPLSPLIPTIPLISRSSQLRETMRARRAVRHGHTHGHIGLGHSRHSSVPNIHYRPPGWNEAMHPESLTHIALSRRRREHASYSVDWSAGAMVSTYAHALFLVTNWHCQMYPPSENSQQFEQYSEGYSTDFRNPYPLAERTYQ